jgi:hypothetical protein
VNEALQSLENLRLSVNKLLEQVRLSLRGGSLVDLGYVAKATAEDVDLSLLLLRKAVQIPIITPGTPPEEPPPAATPTVTLTAPLDGATVTYPTVLTLSATSSDTATTQKIEFYEDATLVGTDTTPTGSTYSVTHTPTVGVKRFTAKLYDTATPTAGQSTSAGATVTVNPQVEGIPVNVAALSRGAVASATSLLSYSTVTLNGPIDADSGTVWASVGTSGTYTVLFHGNVAQILSSVVLGLPPQQYSLRNFSVQYLSTSGSWTTLPGGTFTDHAGGTQTIPVDSILCFGVRVVTTSSWDGTARIVTLQAITLGTPINTPPLVTIIAPTQATATEGANITISATVQDFDGDAINRVEFYDGTTLLATQTAAPYTYNYTNVPLGSRTLKVKAYDANANSFEKTYALTVNPVTTPGDSGSAGFYVRAAKATRALPLQSAGIDDAYIAGPPTAFAVNNSVGVGTTVGDFTGLTPVIDTVFKPRGMAGALKATFPSQSTSSHSGSWWMDFWASRDRNFGPNTAFYFQFLWAQNEAMATTVINQSGGSGGGWVGSKIFDFVPGDRLNVGGETGFIGSSNTDQGKMVVQFRNGGEKMPEGYTYGAGGATVGMSTSLGGGDFDLQPGKDGAVCNYFSVVPLDGSATVPANCFALNRFGEFYVFDGKITLGEFVSGTALINYIFELWITPKGGPLAGIKTKVFDYAGQQSLGGGGIGKLYFQMYFTNKDATQVHDEMACWWSQIIIQDAVNGPIPDYVEPALWQDGMTANQFNEIPGTAPSAFTGGASAWDPTGSVTWAYFILGDYNGVAMDQRTGKMVFAIGGGHASEQQNGVNELDLQRDTPTWAHVRDSTEYAGRFGGYYHTDGRPTGRHTYDNQYIVGTGAGRKLICPFGSAILLSTGNGPYTDTFYFGSTNDWDLFDSNQPQYPGQWASSTTEIASTAHDLETDRIWAAGAGGFLGYYDHNTSTWTKVADSYNGWGIFGVGACIDTKRRKFIVGWDNLIHHGGGDTGFPKGFSTFSLTNPVHVTLQLSGDDTYIVMPEGQGSGPVHSALIYDPVNDRYLHFAQNSGRITSVNPDTGFCTVLAQTFEPPNDAGGNTMLGKIRPAASLGGIVYARRFNENLQFWPFGKIS